MGTQIMKKCRIAVAGLCALVVAGCSSYQITSDPTNAQVFVGGALMGTTPVSFKLPDPVNATLTVKKEGYQDYETQLMSVGSQSYHVKFEEEAPASFIKMMEPSWASVELREGVTFEDAWATLVDLLVKRFDLEVLSKDNGYVRTTWLYSWTGAMREDYRVRVTAKFSPDQRMLEVKSEANFKIGRNWVIGSDTAVLTTLKTDIMGTIGRATR